MAKYIKNYKHSSYVISNKEILKKTFDRQKTPPFLVPFSICNHNVQIQRFCYSNACFNTGPLSFVECSLQCHLHRHELRKKVLLYRATDSWFYRNALPMGNRNVWSRLCRNYFELFDA